MSHWHLCPCTAHLRQRVLVQVGVCHYVLQENFLLFPDLPLPIITEVTGGDFLLTGRLAKLCPASNAWFLPREITGYWEKVQENDAAVSFHEVLIKIPYFY